MADLTSQDRLQPSLLDRLTDDEPFKKVESRDRRVLSARQLRDSALRDLGWLLNTGALSQVEDLEDYPNVRSSVLNFGIPDMAGSLVSSADIVEVERALRQAILDFEPRILPKSLKVRVETEEERMTTNAMVFHIDGELWGQPVPQRLYLKTELDLETGIVHLSDREGS